MITTTRQQQHTAAETPGPLPEQYFPPHRRVNVDYIIDRARAIVPAFGQSAAMTERQVTQLARGAKVWEMEVPGIDCPSWLTPPIRSYGVMRYKMVIRAELAGPHWQALRLHEIAHALGGRFGPAFIEPVRERDCLAHYPVFEGPRNR